MRNYSGHAARKTDPFRSHKRIKVALLFKSHNDLLEEFTYFLPDFSTPAAGKKGAMKGRGKGVLGVNKRKGKGMDGGMMVRNGPFPNPGTLFDAPA